MEHNSNSIKEYLSLLSPCFSETSTLQENAQVLEKVLTLMMPIDGLVLLCTEMREQAGKGWYSKDGTADDCMAQKLYVKSTELSELMHGNGMAEGMPLNHFMGLDEDMQAIASTICYDEEPCGFLVIYRNGAKWNEEERKIISSLSKVMGVAFTIRIRMESEKRINFVFNTVMNRMKTSVYITDVNTDRILFMNQTMKDDFRISHPEGTICYQVLQKGQNKRCRFCPVGQLMQSEEDYPLIQWDELNTVTGRSYRNYDSLIRWMDGSIVHLQQSIDVTEVKTANTDELTQLLTRRPGKIALQETLERAEEEDRLVTVCFYDINDLKDVNDRFGHKEGDHVISTVAWSIRDILEKGEYSFRLSGDEFVVVFLSSQKNAQWRLTKAQKNLSNNDKKYEVGFCFGLMEIHPNQKISAEEAILLADERMYEQKRHFHILRNEYWLQQENRQRLTVDTFQYDKERLYDALAQSTDDYPYICNMRTGVFRYAPAMVKEFNLPSEIIENAAAVWGAKVHENDQAAFLESNQEILDGRTTTHCVEYRVKNRYDEWVWVRCRGHVEMDKNGKPTLFAGFITNLNQKNKIDQLTGLFNKLEFQERIYSNIEGNSRMPFGVMILGIDDLKHINDLYDRIFGDEVIRITSQRLQTLLPPEALIYRLDGDEFGIILQDCNAEDLQKLYCTINYSFENQQEYNGKKYYCTLSGGSVMYPQDVDSYLNIMKYASCSLEYAKRHGKKCCIAYSPSIMDNRARTLEMVEALRASVENDFEGFSLRFQPLVEASTGRPFGAEALARWQSEDFGQVSPVEFIPILEQTGMILPVGKWVLKTAIRQCTLWLQHMPDFVLDVNLSYLQIRGTDFVPFLVNVMEEYNYPPNNLVLELTESYFVQKNQHVQQIFEEIRKMGVRIAMDDFGTGYSTLSILKNIPADIVKIDKTFIRDIRTSTFDATFIRFVAALCHDVGIRVCLEGVETEEEYQIVNKMGLDIIQGFFFGHPLLPEDFEKYCVFPNEALT